MLQYKQINSIINNMKLKNNVFIILISKVKLWFTENVKELNLTKYFKNNNTCSVILPKWF